MRRILVPRGPSLDKLPAVKPPQALYNVVEGVLDFALVENETDLGPCCILPQLPRSVI